MGNSFASPHIPVIFNNARVKWRRFLATCLSEAAEGLAVKPASPKKTSVLQQATDSLRMCPRTTISCGKTLGKERSWPITSGTLADALLRVEVGTGLAVPQVGIFPAGFD